MPAPPAAPPGPPKQFEKWFLAPGEAPIAGILPWPPPAPAPGDPPPPFQAANYTFAVQSMSIANTRSRGEDSDKLSMSVAVGDGAAPTTVNKDLGNVNNGDHPIQSSIGPIAINDPNEGIAFNYLIVNSGHQDWNTVDGLLTQAGQALATAGAKAATAAIGSAIGASIGTGIVPIIGTAIGALAGWLVSELAGLLFANCDGPVAAEQPAFKGIDLWNRTQNGPITLPWGIVIPGQNFGATTLHPGVDSPAGCGSNSQYSVSWAVARV